MAATPHCSTNRPRRPAIRGVLLLIAAVSSIGMTLIPQAANATLPFDPRFPRVAAIRFTDCKPTCESAENDFGLGGSKMFMDYARRRFYAYNTFAQSNFPVGIAIVDMDRLAQTGWLDLTGKLPSDRFTVPVYDQRTGRLVLGEETPQAAAMRFAVVDLLTPDPEPLVVTVPPTLASMNGGERDAVEGDRLSSIAIDEDAQRMYVLTNSQDALGVYDAKGLSVIAYDIGAQALSDESRPLWKYRFRNCSSAVRGKGGVNPPYFDVGEDGGFLYLACKSVRDYGTPLPHGVARLNLGAPTGADPTSGFTSEFFPFAGHMGNGFSMGDPAGDRVAIGVTGLNAQRLFVFDAAHRAWVASLIMGNLNVGGGGTDTGTGRMYVASQDVGLRAIDAAAQPAILLAQPIELGWEFGADIGDIRVDPVTRRVYITNPGFDAGGGVQAEHHLWVWQDLTTPYVPPPLQHPDTQTNDIPEETAEQVSHTAFGSGYGAHAILVGGAGGIAQFANVDVGAMNDFLAGSPQTAPFRLEGGDRGLFLSQIQRAELSGETDRGEAAAAASAMRLDEATAADLEGKYSQFQNEAGIGESGAEPCKESAPTKECLAYRHVIGKVDQLEESSCNDFGDAEDPKTGSRDGSAVECHRLDRVSAHASAELDKAVEPHEVAPVPTIPGAPSAQNAVDQLPVTPPAPPSTAVTYSIAHTDTRTDLLKDPEGGVETTTRSLAKGVTVNVPQLGTLTIGEIEAIAVARAEGRPGSATSSLTTRAKNVVIRDATGKVLFTCGVTNVDAQPLDSDDPEQCSGADAAAGINRYLAPRVQARGPRQDVRPEVTNSPKGAQAIVVKDKWAYLNDSTVNGDPQREVTALDLIFYNDGSTASRVTLNLAGVYAEAQYKIGTERGAIVDGPTKLSIDLVDGESQPLAGGVFQVRRDGGDALSSPLVGACVTGTDGIGDCTFDGLPPGDYVVSQTAPPPGYALADDDVDVSLFPDDHAEASFQNLRAIGAIDITLSDGDGAPLEGGTFDLLADDGNLVRGDADQVVSSCTTGFDGRCGFEEVPLGAYVVHQSATPSGYLVVDDAGFELAQPGQLADLQFTTGLEGIEGSGSEDIVDETARDTAAIDAPTESSEVVIIDPPPVPAASVRHTPIARNGIRERLAAIPAAVAQFLARKPGQAVLFGLVWLLLASPLYLVTRRRSLILAKVAI